MSSSRQPQYSTLSQLDSRLADLRTYFEPTPHYAYLPTALQLFAEFQLLSQLIVSQAVEALRVQEELNAELEEERVPLQQWVNRGSLTRDEGRRVRGWSNRDEEDVMFALSLEVRKHHIAKALSSPGVDPASVTKVINCYFPDLSTSDYARHTMLFIRCMNPEHLAILAEYRKKVIKWHRDALSNYEWIQVMSQLTGRKGRGPPTRAKLVGDNAEEVVRKLGEKMLREAERCLADAEEFEAMFADREGEATGSRRTSQGRGPSSGVTRGEERSTGVTRTVEDNHKSRRVTLSPARSTRPRDPAGPSARPRSSLPAHLSRESPSPTPEHLASLPRLNFSKRPSVTRSSRSPTKPSIPLDHPPLFDPGPSSDIEDTNAHHDHHQPIASSSVLRRSGPPPIFASRSTIPSSGLKSSPHTRTIYTASTPLAGAATKVKKRLSGLPPSVGPDFTAALPTPTRSPGDMRPFSSEELHAGKRKSLLGQEASAQDENRPRQAKRRVVDGREALGSGESQENSQESGKSVTMGVKRDKGKQRAIPRKIDGEMEIE